MDSAEPLTCTVYKSPKKDLLYLYVLKEDDFEAVPEALLASFGHPHKVIGLELSPERKLAQCDVQEVISALREQGYFLQIPPKDATL